MNSNAQCSQQDMFAPKTAGNPPIILELRGIEVPRKQPKDPNRPPNCHVPSFKNNKQLVTKTPQGKPLETPFLITKPGYQQWKEKAVRSLESQLLSMCQTEGGGTQQVRSKLFAILSLMPADDSVNDLPEGNWKVERCKPGQEGAKIVIERIR